MDGSDVGGVDEDKVVREGAWVRGDGCIGVKVAAVAIGAMRRRGGRFGCRRRKRRIQRRRRFRRMMCNSPRDTEQDRGRGKVGCTRRASSVRGQCECEWWRGRETNASVSPSPTRQEGISNATGARREKEVVVEEKEDERPTAEAKWEGKDVCFIYYSIRPLISNCCAHRYRTLMESVGSSMN